MEPGTRGAADDWPVRFGLWYDFRNPASAGRSFESFYAETLEQVVYAEQLGYRSAWLTEHHFADDGYTPSPLLLAAAIAVKTHSLRLSTSLMLLPLHDPIRLAEDAASLAVLSNGRFDLGLGLGYRDIEFQTFGKKLSQRVSIAEEAIPIMRRALAGESIEFQGKRFRYPDVRVTPVAARPPQLLIGGMAEKAIERAARLGDGFLSTQNAHIQPYLDAVERQGKDPAKATVHAGQWVVIDDDPERTWARIGDHAVTQLNQYISWGAFGPPDQTPRFPDRDAVIAAGAYRLLDGPTAVEEIVQLLRQYPQIKDLFFWSQLVGEPVESGSSRMEFFMSEVAPKVVAELQR
ncbi:MAG TPA: LLM class flavin-dependent oxidoreductase [Pseudonocardia sp.]|jgi:alkanesulfonate monooxygenase SsuD/methylene tetrahydromethanopterin reductase-like flavin-dependent oxidoreductase (luciferase family)|nr:LLM class flavin-dependent oxidoreductase [Pseudonocardia sp.]